MTYAASKEFSPIVLSAIAEAKIVASHVIALKPKSYGCGQHVPEDSWSVC